MIRYAALRLQARVVVLLLLTLTLGAVAGCTNFFYDKLDTLARWYIQDLVSLDNDQRSDVHAWLESTLRWHRQSELTRYAQYLRELSNTVTEPGTPASYRAIEVQVED